MARFYHQSSHLGDEFLIETEVERVNLTYEARRPPAVVRGHRWLRLYGGGGYIVRGDPERPRALVHPGRRSSPEPEPSSTARFGPSPPSTSRIASRTTGTPTCRSARASSSRSCRSTTADPDLARVLQRLFAERSVLPGQDRVHRPRHPPLPVLRRPGAVRLAARRGAALPPFRNARSRRLTSGARTGSMPTRFSRRR